jgi:hypothetical protein
VRWPEDRRLQDFHARTIGTGHLEGGQLTVAVTDERIPRGHEHLAVEYDGSVDEPREGARPDDIAGKAVEQVPYAAARAGEYGRIAGRLAGDRQRHRNAGGVQRIVPETGAI